MYKELADRIDYAERKRAQLLTQESPKRQRQERIDAYIIAIVRMTTILTKEWTINERRVRDN